mmetsp:Transcript_26122/g.44460  ORF Transcript_26122/g.44460 Transcript_26122/m.44460 type:complete len:108 (-) Transcript_26122:2145-2468(-)
MIGKSRIRKLLTDGWVDINLKMLSTPAELLGGCACTQLAGTPDHLGCPWSAWLSIFLLVKSMIKMTRLQPNAKPFLLFTAHDDLHREGCICIKGNHRLYGIGAQRSS